MDLTIPGILLLILWFLYRHSKRSPGQPPGPWRLPLIGNGHQVGKHPYTAIAKWAEEYGPILSTDLGPIKTVVISDVKLLKEAYANLVFSGKPAHEAFTVFSGGPYGIVNSQTETWTEQRRFTVRHLRDMGLGKNVMENFIAEEVRELIQRLKGEEGHPVDLNGKFSLAVLNSLWMIVHGKRYSHDDPKLMEVFHTHHDAVETVSRHGILFLFPWFAKLAPDFLGWNKLFKCIDSFHRLFKGSIDEHEKTISQDGGSPRDFVDAYLMEMGRQRDESTSSFNSENGMKNLLGVIGDLFIAGYETTSMTLSWTVLYLAVNAKIQKKLQQEIDTVVGSTRPVTLADRPLMPYAEAVIFEVLRISSIAPMGLLHQTLEDVALGGYKIKKGTFISSNLYTIHNDPKIWGDPRTFRPERFLNSEGTSLIKHESFLPFSVGKRACPGESLARDSLFLFTTNMYQRFRIDIDPLNSNPSFEPALGFLLKPQPFTVILSDRLN